MILKWETEEQRILRFMHIPAKKKLEWLYQMNIFMSKISSKKIKAIRKKMRKNHV